MKYVNASDVLPEKLLTMVQKYYQGGYLYIPKENGCAVRQQTDYKLELAKRNQHIFLNILKEEPMHSLGTFIICRNQVSEGLFQRKKWGIEK